MSARSCALPLLLALLLLLTACSPVSETDDFAYAALPFTASVRGTYTLTDGISRPITARISVGPLLPNGERTMTVSFTQPPSLAGITVTASPTRRSSGEIRRTVTFSAPSDHGDLEFTADGQEFDGFLRFAEALLPAGDVVTISPTDGDGLRSVTRRTADGKQTAVFLLQKGRALPLRVTLTTAEECLELSVDDS